MMTHTNTKTPVKTPVKAPVKAPVKPPAKTPAKTPATTRTRPARAGFSMIELVISMGIFAMGFIAVASLFPTAILMQRETFSSIEAQQVMRNSRAFLKSRGLTKIDLETALSGESTTEVRPLLSDPFLATFHTGFTINDRGYPTETPQADPPTRRYYWFPLVRHIAAGTEEPWEVFVFICRRQAGYDQSRTGLDKDWANQSTDSTKLPAVKRVSAASAGGTITGLPANHGLQPGNEILTDTGDVRTILTASTNSATIVGSFGTPGTEVWYGVAQDDKPNPVRHILTLRNIVQ